LSLDVFETDDEVILKATLPGVKPDDLKVTALGDTVTIQGETKSEENVEGASYTYRERRFGSFRRDVALPKEVDADQAEASFEDGVLTLRFPKPEESKAKTVTVKAK
jgi:HSP20 family protein